MIYFDWDSGNNEDKNRLGLFQQQHKKKSLKLQWLNTTSFSDHAPFLCRPAQDPTTRNHQAPPSGTSGLLGCRGRGEGHGDDLVLALKGHFHMQLTGQPSSHGLTQGQDVAERSEALSVTSKEAQALWVMEAQDWHWCDPESQQLLIFFILGNLLVSPLSWWWPHLTDRRLGNAVSLISGRER